MHMILLLVGLLMGTLDAEEFVVPKRWVHSEVPTDPAKRFSSAPFISGDSFRASCDFIIDETKIPFDPSKVKYADTIFVNGNYIDYFFSVVHPKIKTSYILVTHNTLFAPPGKYVAYLENSKIIAWFGKNADVRYPKMFLIPLGLANYYWPHGKTDVVSALQKQVPYEKTIMLYMNHTVKTNEKERAPVYALFESLPFCTKSEQKPFVDYLLDVAISKFVLSPAGAGLDCHRTWEAMLMGSIPIIKHSILDPMFEDLPVIIVNDWHEVTEEFLNERYEHICRAQYNTKKLYIDYWIEQIRTVQQEARARKK